MSETLVEGLAEEKTRAEAAEARVLAPAKAEEPVDPTPRCPRCGWPLANAADGGCVLGNCSYRPAEGTEEHERVKRWDRAQAPSPSAEPQEPR